MSLTRFSSDTLCALGLLLFSLLLWFWLIPGFIGPGDDRALPWALTLIIGALALILLMVSLSRQGKTQIAADEEDPFLERDEHGEPWRLYLLIAMWGADVYLMRVFGFYPLSLLAVAASFVILGMHDWRRIPLWSVAPLIVVYLVFEQGFSLRMPRGSLFVSLLG